MLIAFLPLLHVWAESSYIAYTSVLESEAEFENNRKCPLMEAGPLFKQIKMFFFISAEVPE